MNKNLLVKGILEAAKDGAISILKIVNKINQEPLHGAVTESDKQLTIRTINELCTSKFIEADTRYMDLSGTLEATITTEGLKYLEKL